MKHLVSISRTVLGLFLNVYSIFILCQSNMFSKESWVNGSIMAIDAFLLNFRTSASELLWAKLVCSPWRRIMEEREREKIRFCRFRVQYFSLNLCSLDCHYVVILFIFDLPTILGYYICLICPLKKYLCQKFILFLPKKSTQMLLYNIHAQL